jgi:hypothetical protein
VDQICRYRFGKWLNPIREILIQRLERERGRAHWKEVDGEASAVLEIVDGAVPVIAELHEDDDDVRLGVAKAMAKRRF